MGDGPEEAFHSIRRFLESAKAPALIEAGDDPIPLSSENYLLDFDNGRLMLQAWSRERNLVRRITSIAAEKPGRLELCVERFGKKTGSIELVDVSKPRNQTVHARASRLAYREQFRRSLLRQFTGWRISEITSEQDLEHSFSPAFPRALLTRGTTAIAAIGASSGGPSDPNNALTFGLLWLDYVRRREPRLTIEKLALFLPEGSEKTTCLRLRCLDANAADWSVFIYGDVFEDPVDLRDYGNIDTTLPVRRHPHIPPEWIGQLEQIPEVERVQEPDGTLTWRVRGLTFAHFDGYGIRFGIETKCLGTESKYGEIEALALELARFRCAETVDRRGPLFLRNPELWLESQIRSLPAELDASLMAPVYGQVPAVAGGERGVLDLLATDFAGRLAVVEVKASEDLHLPLQALDYWMRVKWHLDRDEFGAHGYFPGKVLSKQSPRLLLVAPSLCFHPANETVLRFFAPNIEVERIGLGMDWRHQLKVVFRTKERLQP